MAIYSIHEIEELTGVKAHTIRMWEKRYGLDVSKRTKGNVRYFEEDGLKMLLNISVLNKSGVKISKIAKMDEGEIKSKAAEAAHVHSSHLGGVDALTLSIINLDQSSFDTIVNKHIKQEGFKSTLENLIFPLFDKVNEMYLTGTVKPVNEAFLNQLLLGKMLVQIDQLRAKIPSTAPKYFLFQPALSNEELSVVILNYYLVYHGLQAINIGANIMPNDIVEAYEVHQPNYIIGLFNALPEDVSVMQYVDTIKNKCPDSELVLSGYLVLTEGIAPSEGVKVMEDLNTLLDFIKESGQ